MWCNHANYTFGRLLLLCCIPHQEAAKHAAMDVALLRLTHEGVLHDSVLHQQGLTRSQGGHICHSPCLS